MRKFQPQPDTETKISVLVEEIHNHVKKIALHFCSAATSDLKMVAPFFLMYQFPVPIAISLMLTVLFELSKMLL